MAHANLLTDSVSPAVAAFFKSDRPRTIDRFIDYFGGDGTASGADEEALAEEHVLVGAVAEELMA